MNYYQRLKDLREDKEKLQFEVAEILGITQQQYSRYERGLREIPFHHVITLAQYYNISLDYLAGLIDVPRKIR